MTRAFKEIRGRLGFGMMRLPVKGEEIDTETVCRMVDRFIEGGFNYFDTAHGYHTGKSEIAVRECLSSRHDRSEFILTDKLTDEYFKCQEDIVPLFESQLEACGVDYFDFYLMHAQNARNFEFFKSCKAYETALELREQGRIRHMGISFHDSPEVLDRILTEYPQIEVVQIQFNYADYDDKTIQSGRLLEVCRSHGKPVLVMEPVRGGKLAVLPEQVGQVFDELRRETGSTYSNAAYALRFAAGFDGMEVILSGMSSMEQMEDNMSFMMDPEPLSEAEKAAVFKAADTFKEIGSIKCTACRYCIEENQCPKDILIPDLFECMNRKTVLDDWSRNIYYNTVATVGHGKASDCIECGMCEKVCPQHLEIRELLKSVAEMFEKKEENA